MRGIKGIVSGLSFRNGWDYVNMWFRGQIMNGKGPACQKIKKHWSISFIPTVSSINFCQQPYKYLSLLLQPLSLLILSRCRCLQLKYNYHIHILMSKQPRRRVHLTETFQSSMHEEASNKFHLDKTLYKGIKDNDVSKIIDCSRDATALTRNLPDQGEELAALVADTRRRYDEVRTEAVRLEAELDKQRRLSDALKEEESHLQQHIAGTRKNLQDRQQQHEEALALVEARVYDLDIYKSLEERLKHDILIMRKRNFDKDGALKKQAVKLRGLRQEEFNKTKISYRCRDMLESIEKTVANKQVERTSKINSLYEVIERRQETAIRREQRGRELQQVMMRAMSEKLQEEKECLNILMTNLFLKGFLKNKMERIIAENSQIERAYHQIRSNTDVRDSKELIHRFLNRERNYGALLDTIAEKEHFLETLKAERETLEQQQHGLAQTAEELHEGTAREIGKAPGLQKQLDGLQATLKDIKHKKDLMRKWATRFHSAFTGRSREQPSRPFKDMMLEVLGEISKYTEHLLGDENSGDSINRTFMSTKPSLRVFEEEMGARNTRVRTAAAEEEVDDRDGGYDGASEAEYLHHNRRMIKKSEQSRRFRIKTQNK